MDKAIAWLFCRLFVEILCHNLAYRIKYVVALLVMAC